MRTIKFRGKRVDKDELVFGDLLTGMGYKKGKFYILPHLTHYPSDCNSLDGYEVETETVGQFTGLYDKDGKEIYDGDILSIKDGCALLTVEFRHGAFGYEYCGEFHSWAGNHNFTFNPFDTDVDFAIIGNIHDNPELLKGGNQ